MKQKVSGDLAKSHCSPVVSHLQTETDSTQVGLAAMSPVTGHVSMVRGL